MSYRSLNADSIEATLQRLSRRIEERFPGRGINQVCAELVTIAGEDKERAHALSRSYPWLRAGVAGAILAGVGGLVLMVRGLPALGFNAEATSLVQALDASLNVAALAGATVWFLLNLEGRIRRSRILEDLHGLRSIAHVIDMHQLTKDPTAFLAAPGQNTPSSPERNLSMFELTRYLEYCSEMLSLTGKLAALYMRDVRDPVIISTVNEIEDLTTSLSRKIWQKIMLIRSIEAPSGAMG